jgi:hypothetical protein
LIIKLYLKISSQENSEKKRRNGDWPYIKARYKTVIVKVGWHWHMNGNIHPEYSPEIDPNVQEVSTQQNGNLLYKFRT